MDKQLVTVRRKKKSPLPGRTKKIAGRTRLRVGGHLPQLVGVVVIEQDSR